MRAATAEFFQPKRSKQFPQRPFFRPVHEIASQAFYANVFCLPPWHYEMQNKKGKNENI